MKNHSEKVRAKRIKKCYRFIVSHWKTMTLVMALIILFSSIYIINDIIPKQTQAGNGFNAILPPSMPSVASPYGGKITSTLDCSSVAMCGNPICLLGRCILQVPFVIHFFDNYKQTNQNGLDKLKDELLEPKELEKCSEFCAQLGLNVTCSIWCGAVLPGLQEANKSPVDIAVDALVSTNMTTPGVAFIIAPVEIGMPACNSMGYLLGKGFGEGLYFNLPPGQLTPVGDSCRGNYYLTGGF